MHIRRDHGEQQPHNCEHCNFTSSSKAMLNRHIERNHGEQQPQEMRKRYTCDKCEFITTSTSILTKHREIQHKQKLIKTSKRKTCEVCNKRFNKEITYNSHMKKVHKESDLRGNEV